MTKVSASRDEEEPKPLTRHSLLGQVEGFVSKGSCTSSGKGLVPGGADLTMDVALTAISHG